MAIRWGYTVSMLNMKQKSSTSCATLKVVHQRSLLRLLSILDGSITIFGRQKLQATTWYLIAVRMSLSSQIPGTHLLRQECFGALMAFLSGLERFPITSNWRM
jgi:hypothetical protein